MTLVYVTIDDLFSSPVSTNIPDQVRRMFDLRLARQRPHSVQDLLDQGYTKQEIDSTPITESTDVRAARNWGAVAHLIP
ncbi:hypothetical protein CL614_06285 [archaeon]|nr:hypothetical protein [archaeon]|tara:strand:- start:503 stop:739 length:237 start_codon:yes stop_codon:yes gene_type:complete